MTSRFACTLICLLFLFAVVEARTWTPADGTTIEGNMIKADKASITVRDLSGKAIELGLEDLSSKDKAYVKGFQSGKNKRYLEMLGMAVKLIDQIPAPEVQLKHKVVNGAVPLQEICKKDPPLPGLVIDRSSSGLGNKYYEYQERLYHRYKNKDGTAFGWYYIGRMSGYYNHLTGEAVSFPCKKSEKIYSKFDIQERRAFVSWIRHPDGVAFITEMTTQMTGDGDLMPPDELSKALDSDRSLASKVVRDTAHYILFLDERGQMKYGMVSIVMKNKQGIVCCFDGQKNIAPIDWFSPASIQIGPKFFNSDLEEEKVPAK